MLYRLNLHEAIDIVSRLPVATNMFEVLSICIVCLTIALCIYFITKCISTCIKENCNAKLQEQIKRQEYELNKKREEKEELEAKWMHEHKVRVLEHNWKMQDKRREHYNIK